MLSLFKKFLVFLLLVLLISCEGLSELLSTNHFSGMDEGSGVVISPEDLKGWIPEEINEKLNYYSDIILSIDDADSLFSVLINDPVAKAEFLSNFKLALNFTPDLTKEEDVDRYQKFNAAYAKVEVYSTETTILEGVDNLIVDYASGASSGDFNQDTLLTEVFNIPAVFDTPEQKEQRRQELITEINALVNAGDAYENLGNSITDVDRPSSRYISDEDAVLVLLTAMTGRIIQKTVESTSLTKTQAVEELVNGIVNKNFTGSQIMFPVSPGNTASNPMELYLGPGGSLAFTATGFQLPPVSSLGGS